MERTKKVLAELGVNPPDMPPFDPAKVEPIPYEDEIRAFIKECSKLTNLDREADEVEKALAALKPQDDAIVIVGQSALNEADGAAVLAACQALSGRMLVLHTAAARVGEVVAVHVIARPHVNVDAVMPLGRGDTKPARK